MEFKLCECILPNGEMCARYIEKTDDSYCCKCKEMNLNTELTSTVYNEQPTFSASVCSMMSIFLMSMSMLFFCGKRKRHPSHYPKRSLNNAVIPFNENVNQ